MADWSQYLNAQQPMGVQLGSPNGVQLSADSRARLAAMPPDPAGAYAGYQNSTPTPDPRSPYSMFTSGLGGLAQGATGGLIKYPLAVAAYLDDRYHHPGARDQMSWQDAVNATGDELQAAHNDNPVTSTLGQLGGGIYSAVRLGGLASKAIPEFASVPQVVLGNAAAGGLQGGVSGFTANNGMDNALSDTSTGAYLGGGLGALGTAGGLGLAKLGVNRVMSAMEQAKAFVANKYASPQQLENLENVVKYIKSFGIENAGPAVENMPDGPAKAAAVAAMLKSGATSNAVDGIGGIGAAQGLTPSTLEKFRDFITPTAVQGGVGSLLGSGLAAITGHDPILGALLGGGSTSAASLMGKAATIGGPQLAHNTLNYLERNPQTALHAGQVANGAMSGSLMGPITQSTSTAAGAVGDRLRSMADALRSKMAPPAPGVQAPQAAMPPAQAADAPGMAGGGPVLDANGDPIIGQKTPVRTGGGGGLSHDAVAAAIAPKPVPRSPMIPTRKLPFNPLTHPGAVVDEQMRQTELANGLTPLYNKPPVNTPPTNSLSPAAVANAASAAAAAASAPKDDDGMADGGAVDPEMGYFNWLFHGMPSTNQANDRKIYQMVKGVQAPIQARPASAPASAASAAPMTMQNMQPGYQLLDDDVYKRAAAGGYLPSASAPASAASGMKSGGPVHGSGDGQSDKVNRRLSPGEYVIDADTVSALGNGNTAAGVAALDKMREAIRSQKRAAPANAIPAKSAPPLAYLSALGR